VHGCRRAILYAKAGGTSNIRQHVCIQLCDGPACAAAVGLMASGILRVVAGEGPAIMGKLPAYCGAAAGVGARAAAMVQQLGLVASAGSPGPCFGGRISTRRHVCSCLLTCLLTKYI
jgi:hypothetical protein